MWIGRNRLEGDKISKIRWTDNGIRILGIYFSYDEKETMRINVDKRLDDIKCTFLRWKKRGLTLIGKIQLLKTFAVSKIMYFVSNIQIPDDFVKKVERMMFEFLWNGPDKISRATMYAEYVDGGLKFPNLRCMIERQLVKWIQRYIMQSNHNWKTFFDHYCKRFGGK